MSAPIAQHYVSRLIDLQRPLDLSAFSILLYV